MVGNPETIQTGFWEIAPPLHLAQSDPGVLRSVAGITGYSQKRLGLPELVGYSPRPIRYPGMFSPTCTKSARILTISMISHSATLSTVPHKYHQFPAETDTKDTRGFPSGLTPQQMREKPWTLPSCRANAKLFLLLPLSVSPALDANRLSHRPIPRRSFGDERCGLPCGQRPTDCY